MVKNVCAVCSLKYMRKDKTGDVIGIKCEIKNFKKFCSLNHLSDLKYVFSVRLVATRFSKLDPILICFDDVFFKPKIYPPITRELSNI